MSRTSSDNRMSFVQWYQFHIQNRALSIRQNRNSGRSSSSGGGGAGVGAGGSGSRRGFSLSSLRGSVQPELSKRLFRLIKSENALVGAHRAAARERGSIATQLSEWGEQTGDEAVSDVSDKVGVVLSELGEQEEAFARALDGSRGVLKTVRNVEKSVQPSRDHKAKVADEIARIKGREPDSTKLVVLEQELVRSEAENLVAEAQLSNITRQKLREAYDAEFTAVIERAEKQIILARHGQRLLRLLDDTPVVPGDTRPAYGGAQQARQILNDAEDDLRDWSPEGDDHDRTRTPEQDRLTLGGAFRRDSGYAQQRDLGQSREYDKENHGYGCGYGEKDADEERLERDMETTREAISTAGGTRGEMSRQGERTTFDPGRRGSSPVGAEGKARLMAELCTSTQLPHQPDGFDTPQSVDSDGWSVRGRGLGYSSG